MIEQIARVSRCDWLAYLFHKTVAFCAHNHSCTTASKLFLLALQYTRTRRSVAFIRSRGHRKRGDRGVCDVIDLRCDVIELCVVVARRFLVGLQTSSVTSHPPVVGESFAPSAKRYNSEVTNALSFRGRRFIFNFYSSKLTARNTN